MKVTNHHSGSRCVVWFTAEHYIDVRRDFRNCRYEVAECIRYGHVYRTVHIDLVQDAPAQLIKLIREELT